MLGIRHSLFDIIFPSSQSLFLSRTLRLHNHWRCSSASLPDTLVQSDTAESALHRHKFPNHDIYFQIAYIYLLLINNINYTAKSKLLLSF